MESFPIFIADYVMMGYGTGAIMAVPAHDERDWAFARKFGVDIIPVIEGGDIDKAAYTGNGPMINSDFLNVYDNKKDSIAAMLLEHMLLSHHGQPEFGSPKLPMFPEAEVLSTLDRLDAQLFEMFTALDGVVKGGFSERQWALDNRQLYQHGRKGTK